MGATEEDRFARLVHEHSAAVASYLRRRLYPLTSADLDDLVEETMLVVWRRLDRVPVDAERPGCSGRAQRAAQCPSLEESSFRVRSDAALAVD